MAVYFVERSFRHPTGFALTRLNGKTVLDWCKDYWKRVRSGGDTTAEAGIGLGNLAEHIRDDDLPTPKSMKQVAEQFKEAVGAYKVGKGTHHIQYDTDDPLTGYPCRSVYLFDDTYAAEHPDRAAFLLHDGWPLPDGAAVGDFTPPDARVGGPDVHGEGLTHLAYFYTTDDPPPTMYPHSVVGARIPDLPRPLFHMERHYNIGKDVGSEALSDVMSGFTSARSATTGTEELLLKAVSANPHDVVCWGAYSDWCEENGKPALLQRILERAVFVYGFDRHGPRVGADTCDPKKDRVLVQTHVAQASKHVARHGDTDLYHHLVLFDDLWANAHPHHAASLLRAASRWDIL